jgi:hypothetical protein
MNNLIASVMAGSLVLMAALPAAGQAARLVGSNASVHDSANGVALAESETTQPCRGCPSSRPLWSLLPKFIGELPVKSWCWQPSFPRRLASPAVDGLLSAVAKRT